MRDGEGRNGGRDLALPLMYAIRPVCGHGGTPLADYAWRGEWRGEEARTDSMHVRYYTVFSVYLFHARLRGAQHSAIRNYSGTCVAEHGHIRPYVVPPFADGFSSGRRYPSLAPPLITGEISVEIGPVDQRTIASGGNVACVSQVE